MSFFLDSFSKTLNTMDEKSHNVPPPAYSKSFRNQISKHHVVLWYSGEPSSKNALAQEPHQTGNPQYQTQGPVPGIAPTYANAYMPMAAMVHFGRIPTQCVCPQCHLNIVTRTENKTGMLMWLICIGLALFGFVLGCCLIPFCIDDLGNVEHYCPHCATLVGEHRPL